MPLGEIGAILLFLLVVFIFGNLWFHFIEAILNIKIKEIVQQQGTSLKVQVAHIF